MDKVPRTAMRRFAIPAALIATAVATLMAPPAEAQTKRRAAVPAGNEITVTGRSYLDAGVVVRPGTTGSLNYIYVGQGLAQPVYQNLAPLFGSTTLPGRFDLPNCCGSVIDIPGGPFISP
jgi:hypothetical protein